MAIVLTRRVILILEIVLAAVSSVTMVMIVTTHVALRVHFGVVIKEVGNAPAHALLVCMESIVITLAMRIVLHKPVIKFPVIVITVVLQVGRG